MKVITLLQGEIITRVKIHWKFLKIFFSRTSRPISIKLGINYPWVKRIINCSNKGPGACFTKELTITIKFYLAHYSLIRSNLKRISIVLKRI
jgi:hypothetical protein